MRPKRNTFCLVCLDSRTDLWVSGCNDCLGKSNTVYHLLSIWFIDWVDWSQFNQLESVILTSMAWCWSISPEGFGLETKGGSVSFGWHLFCKPRWTAFVLCTLVALEVVCIAHAVPQGFVTLWNFWTAVGNQGQQPLSPVFFLLLCSWPHFTAVLGFWVCWLQLGRFLWVLLLLCNILGEGRKLKLARVFPFLPPRKRRWTRHNASLALLRGPAEPSIVKRNQEHQHMTGKARHRSANAVTALVLSTLDISVL